MGGQTIQIAAGATTSIGAGATQNYQLNGYNINTGIAVTARTAGVFSLLSIRTTANATTTGPNTFKLRINSTDVNETISIPTGAGGIGYFQDTTHTDVIAAGNTHLCSMTCGTGGGITSVLITAIFTATTNTVTQLKSDQDGNSSVIVAGTYFFPIQGTFTFNTSTTETFQKVRIKHAGTLRNFRYYGQVNAGATNVVLVRKNGADSTMTTGTLTGLLSGLFEDTTHTESIAIGDDLNYSSTITSTAGVSNWNLYAEFETTTAYGMNMCSASSGYAQPDATTEYRPIGGSILLNATQSVAQMQAGAAFTFSNLRCMQSVSDTPTAAVTFMKGGVAQTQTLTTTASSTGLFEDVTHTDTVGVSDLIDHRVVTSSVTGAHFATLTWIAMDSLGPIVTIPQTVWIEWEES